VKAGPAPDAPEAPKTLEAVFEEWAKEEGRGHIRWADKDRRVRRNLLPEFGSRPFAEITRTEVVTFLKKIAAAGHARTADMCAADLRVLEAHFAEGNDDYVFKFRGYIKRRSTAKPRKRKLTNDEVRALWLAAGNGPSDGDKRFGAIVKLLLLTLQRLDKVVTMRWCDLDLIKGLWTVPRDEDSDAKGVPLCALSLPPAAPNLIKAQEIEADGRRYRLSEEFVFPASRGRGHISGISGYKIALEKRAGLFQPGWVLHDLRRTSRTRLGEIKTTITLDDGHFRMIENRWVGAESSFIPLEWWDLCIDPELRSVVVERYLTVWIGVDASVRRDSTAIVAVTWSAKDFGRRPGALLPVQVGQLLGSVGRLVGGDDAGGTTIKPHPRSPRHDRAEVPGISGVGGQRQANMPRVEIRRRRGDVLVNSDLQWSAAPLEHLEAGGESLGKNGRHGGDDGVVLQGHESLTLYRFVDCSEGDRGGPMRRHNILIIAEVLGVVDGALFGLGL
jgi:integrase